MPLCLLYLFLSGRTNEKTGETTGHFSGLLFAGKETGFSRFFLRAEFVILLDE